MKEEHDDHGKRCGEDNEGEHGERETVKGEQWVQ